MLHRSIYAVLSFYVKQDCQLNHQSFFFLNECINSGLKLWFVKGVDRVTFVICVIMMYSV